MLTKKYFSISEAKDMCSLASHKLRYIDKVDKKISIVRIRGRRYYTIENINYLIKTYSDISQAESTKIEPQSNSTAYKNYNSYDIFLEKIDQLINNLHSIQNRLR